MPEATWHLEKRLWQIRSLLYCLLWKLIWPGWEKGQGGMLHLLAPLKTWTGRICRTTLSWPPRADADASCEMWYSHRQMTIQLHQRSIRSLQSFTGMMGRRHRKLSPQQLEGWGCLLLKSEEIDVWSSKTRGMEIVS